MYILIYTDKDGNTGCFRHGSPTKIELFLIGMRDEIVTHEIYKGKPTSKVKV